MMKVKADIGNKKVLLRIDNLDKSMKAGIRAGFFALAKDLKSEANREILRKPKGGRVYIIRGPSGRRRRHVASAAGETHANMSGALRKSLGWQVSGYKLMEFGYGVLSQAQAPDYAPFVENGTSRMGSRPSLGNAVIKTNRNAEKHFEDGILRKMKK